ncbi:tetratricopeptide repeat-containing sensor histidine kinase [uncultured Tenacibaculum sp.]|uniref:ATP-binding protein n=1 Tax=uncultured Tenacibaculum sp. TaxID=174713 RepID=UPI00260ECB6C|nr:tetratricopeptide repeat-containing sensor histidine kinase [uncultured Tenacibaculum sp.]
MLFYRNLLILFILLQNNVYSQSKIVLSPFFKEVKTHTDEFKSKSFKKVQSYFLNKEWDSTLIYSLKELSIPQNDSKIIDYCHFFRGYSFKQKKLFEDSKNEFQSVSKDFFFYERIDMYLGEMLLVEKNYKKALKYFQKFQKTQTYKGKTIKRTSVLENIGTCYLHLKQYELSKKYIEESLKILEQKKDTLGLINSYGNVATLYYDQYQDDIAIPLYQKAYDLSLSINDFTVKSRAAKNMYVVEKNRKNYKKALPYFEEHKKWKDSVQSEAKRIATIKREKEYLVQQKQRELNDLQAENKIQEAERKFLLYSAGFLILLLLAGSYFYSDKLKTNKVISAQNKKLDELNETKNKLFSIVSHDLRSSVNTLKLSNKKLLKNVTANDTLLTQKLLKENSTIVNSAYQLLDNLLNWALLQTKQSYFEVKEIQLFRAIEHIAYNYKPLFIEKELNFENNIATSVKILADQESLKIIFRNLLDNAIKFSNQRGDIKLYTNEEDKNYVTIILEDTGIGMDETTRLKLQNSTTLTVNERSHKKIIGSGLGLQLCKSMIQKNKGKFSIESQLGKGTKMIVSLPKAAY